MLATRELLIPAALGAALACSSAHAQTYGGVSGTVRDASHAVVEGAKVAATNLSTNAVVTAVSSREGFYTFPNLSVGTYSIAASNTGFSTQVQQGVHINVASAVTLDFTLAPGEVAQSVQVSSQALAIDTTSAALGHTMDTRQIDELPMNGRDYARLSLLTPGAVARSSYIADLSFDGLHTVHNQFSIDGIDASRVDQPYMANGYERGARLLTGSLETVAEFKVQTSGYQAQYGRAAGSEVNIVTKSGGNHVHGELYDYFRNDALDASNFFALTKPEFRFNDFGANISGPIRHDKTFYFVNYEGSRQLVGITANGTVPSAKLISEVQATSPQLAPILAQMPAGTAPTANDLVDNYTTNAVSNVREDTGSVRVDQIFSEKDAAFGRLNINDTNTFGPLFGVTSSAFGVNDHQIVPIRTTNFALHESHVFNPHMVNDTLVGMQRWVSTINSYEDVPNTTITGLTISPGNQGLYFQAGTSFQYGDTLTYVHGQHTIKTGGSVYRIQVNRSSSDYDSILFASIDDFIHDRLATASITVGDPGHGTRATQLGFFGQDTWQLRSNLTMDYGLRYDIETVPHDSHYATQTYDPSTGMLDHPGGSYFHINNKNFQPRLGFAWQPTPKTVVRTAVGLFFQAYPVGFGSYNVPLNNIAGNVSLNSATVPTLGYPYTPYLSDNTAAAPTVYGFPTHKPDIYSEQWNFSVAYQLAANTGVEVAYVGNHGVNLWREEDVNYASNVTGVRPNAAFSDIYLETNSGFSSYSGLQLSIIRRVTQGLHVEGAYTYGHVIDNVQDQGLFASEPQNNNDIAAERGNGSGDIRHNFSFNLLYDLPMGSGHRFLSTPLGVASTLVSGWQVNALGLIHSGIADNVAYGGNSYGNGDFTNQRPDQVFGQPEYAPNRSYRQFFNPAAWTAPATGTFGNSPRNSVYGPGLAQIDSALVKETPLGEGRSVEFRSEFFNMFNHPNFGQPDSTYGDATFGQIFSTFGRTIGFGTSRQIEFALKLRY
ncbi:TonB-dependent receptor [Acidipila sp. EB88]|uniref:TonB-dependent receptor n=1 Tax=Acidipila sp. EB88 TaxID=2305226 RepID=UPI0013157FFD|nr:TonB-dependent receptor [Acidipila sp. EB88]